MAPPKAQGKTSAKPEAVKQSIAHSAIQALTLTGFRSHGELSLIPQGDKRAVILVGENGVGKTNILEAISLLAPGRGLRSAKNAELAERGGDGSWSVHARIAEGGAVGVGCAPHSNSKQLRINGTKLALRELGGVLPMLWLTPAHDRLFLEGASGRRRFLDRFGMALFPEYSLYLAAYERAMRERNRLLALGEGEKWLNAVEGEMAVNGVHLAELRLSAFERLSEEAMRADGGNFPPLDMKLNGEWEMVVKEKDHGEAQGLFARSLCEGRGLDAKAGRCLSGPHRSDVHIHHIAKNMPAPLCSTGEQKALLLALFLAKARICKASSGKSALLLLDEISAHLDTPHRKALFGELAKIGGQVWMSGTHESLFEHCPKKQLFHLPQGESKP